MSEPAEPQCISRDRRGWIYLIKGSEGREAILIFTRKGYLRGGEYHDSDQRTFVVSGELRWNLGTKYRGGGIQRRGEDALIKAGIPHIAEALEDTLYVEYLEGKLGKTLVPEMRRLVEEKMKE